MEDERAEEQPPKTKGAERDVIIQVPTLDPKESKGPIQIPALDPKETKGSRTRTSIEHDPSSPSVISFSGEFKRVMRLSDDR